MQIYKNVILKLYGTSDIYIKFRTIIYKYFGVLKISMPI